MTPSRLALSLFAVATAAAALPAQTPLPVPPSLFAELEYRNIGPYRAGRTKAAASHPSQPFTFYIGMVNGGVWKTTDAGRTWKPIFEDQPTGSIGWVSVAPSNPNVIYVGSGEGLPRPDLAVGDGVYKSTDAGATWTHLGLRDTQQIPKIAVDPRNADRLFVAALGHPYGPNEERGVFRSTDGGRTFDRVLFKNENIGAKDVDIDPSNPNVVYATLWEQRQGPWENGAWSGTNGGIFKSTDGGTTWTQLTQGLPAGIINAELAVSPARPSLVFATIEAGNGGTGIYRSDDAGVTWSRATTDARPTARINEVVPHPHPTDPNTLIITDIVSFKSTDGGKTFVPFKGAPGGDDNQNIWWNPDNPDIMLLVIDQGAVVTLNGGKTWSSWFNQSTAALYHVMTDNAFPYRVCGGQQDSGSICIASRGNDGQITMREWHPVGVEEYGYAAPDPLDPDIIYGGKVTRYDRRTGQVSDVGPVSGRGGVAGAPSYRTVRTQPVVFSEVDKRAMFYGNNVLWKTLDGGLNWKQISPDLTRATWTVPKNVGIYTPRVANTTRGSIGAQVIYTIAPSYKDINRIWIGTDDGTIATTIDGGLTWKNVTPPEITDFQKVFTIDGGRFDAGTAYAAVNTLRLDDMNPHIYRTHDGGKTWKEIVNGIPGGAPVSVVREDPKRKGLLFAGSETQVYVSFDDGDHWQSLRLNMAASSIRDLVIKDDDLVVGTHGRGIWILDDITPLRQITAATANETAVLFKPQTAMRVRWNTNTDTPLPPDEPVAPNPPEGAIINYYLKSDATGPVTLEILDGTTVLRKYSSEDSVFKPDAATSTVPLYWYRNLKGLSAKAGMHRFTWDVHYQPLDGSTRLGGPTLPIASIGYNTVPLPTTPWANPGTYTVRLTVNGKAYTQPITVKLDPRVKTPALYMQQIYTLSRAAYDEALATRSAATEARALREQIAKVLPQATGATAAALSAYDRRLDSLAGAAATASGGRGGGAGGRGGAAHAPAVETLSGASTALAGVMNLLQGADVRPTTVQLNAISKARAEGQRVMTRWRSLRGTELVALNRLLTSAGLTAIGR
ncbi:MAG: WD40/YVTN/BNR-like repeat-containing protein [Gemmatimonas sp.]